MNKRSFIKSLLVAAVAPTVLIPKYNDSFKWRKSNSLWQINPEWEKATYTVESVMPFDQKEFFGEWRFVGHSDYSTTIFYAAL